MAVGGEAASNAMVLVLESAMPHLPQDPQLIQQLALALPRRDFSKKAESKAVWGPKPSDKKVIIADTSDEEDGGKAAKNKQVKPAPGGNKNARPQRSLAEMKNKPYSLGC